MQISISYDSQTLQLTIPEKLPIGYKLYIHVSGRLKMGDGAMSFHAFEEESGNYSWELGKTYTRDISGDSLLEGLVVIGLVKDGQSEVEYEYRRNFGLTPQGEESSLSDVSMVLDSISSGGLSFIFENQSDNKYLYGSGYMLFTRKNIIGNQSSLLSREV